MTYNPLFFKRGSLGLMAWLNFIPCGFLILYLVGSSGGVTKFDDFCLDREAFEPYVRYYFGGRVKAMEKGIPDVIHPPGLWVDIANFADVYVCINGLTWFYYARSIFNRDVMEKPKLFAFEHHCMFVNGKMGPGNSSVLTTLLGILLIGKPDSTDYRSPAVQLFNAPFQKDEKSKVINANSLLIIGEDTECVIKKTQKKGLGLLPFRVKIDKDTAPAPVPEPDEKEVTFCKLSYKHLKDHLAPPVAPDTGDRSFAYAESILKVNNATFQSECYVHNNYTAATHQIVKERVPIILYKTWNVTHEPYLDKDKYFEKDLKADPAADINPGDFLPDKDVCEWGDPAKPPAQPDPCSEEEINKQIEANIKDLSDTDKVKQKEARKKIMDAKLNPYRTVAFLRYQQLLDLDQKLMEVWGKEIVDRKDNGTNATKPNTAESIESLGEVFINKTSPFNVAVTEAANDLQDDVNAFEKATEEDKKKEIRERIKTKQATLDEKIKLREVEMDKLANKISEGENLRASFEAQKFLVKTAFNDLIAKFKLASNDQNITFVPEDTKVLSSQAPSQMIIVGRKGTLLKKSKPIPEYENENTQSNQCGKLPTRKSICTNSKPTGKRACQLLTARQGKMRDEDGKDVTWEKGDEWREDVFNYVQTIFNNACAKWSRAKEFTKGVINTMKAYLIDYVEDTLPRNTTDSADPKPKINLPIRRQEWDQVMKALKDCSMHMEYRINFKNPEPGATHGHKLMMTYPGNGSSEDVVVQNFIEQADKAYGFNFIIDSMWRIFSTALGVCMRNYNQLIPHMSAKFYSYFSEDFFHPLVEEWVNVRDNIAHSYLMGEYYKDTGPYWSKMCMEASFVASGDVAYRPLRNLLVNDKSEANFFPLEDNKDDDGIIKVPYYQPTGFYMGL